MQAHPFIKTAHTPDHEVTLATRSGALLLLPPRSTFCCQLVVRSIYSCAGWRASLIRQLLLMTSLSRVPLARIRFDTVIRMSSAVEHPLLCIRLMEVHDGGRSSIRRHHTSCKKRYSCRHTSQREKRMTGGSQTQLTCQVGHPHAAILVYLPQQMVCVHCSHLDPPPRPIRFTVISLSFLWVCR